MWTGFYVGLNAGGTWANSNQQVIAVGPVGADTLFPHAVSVFETSQHLAAFSAAASASGFNNGNNGGFIGGGQVGYNWQFYNSFVAGIEADIQGIAGNQGSRTFVTSAPVGVDVYGLQQGFPGSNYVGIHSARASLDYLGTVRGRLGWLFTPTLLVYGTGGFAFGGLTLNSVSSVYNDLYPHISTAIGGVNFSNTQTGWTAGGGLEWMFWPNWSVKAEYLYYDLGTAQQGFALTSTDTWSNLSAVYGGALRARVNGNVVRAGLNYHFNWGAPAPVAARY
jgi:outer membrane immunogenic protein